MSKTESGGGLTDPQIAELLSRAERLSNSGLLGVLRIPRQRTLSQEGINAERAILIDEWVVRHGGTIRSLKRPPSRGIRAGRRVAGIGSPPLVVWELPQQALQT
jgi:hypothetical protein